MELLNLFKRSVSGKSGINELYLDHLRYIKLLENTRIIMNLFGDGQEKACGEYILDVHYVTAMVEETIRVLGTLVFDACVMRNHGGDALFHQWDDQKKRAGKILLSVQNGSWLQGSSGNEDPEYRLLKDVLNWFDPEKGDKKSSVMGFVREIFNHIMTRTCTVPFPFTDMPALAIPCQGIVHRIHFLPVGDETPLSGKSSVEASDCRPLRVMFRDSPQNAITSDSGLAHVRWAAVMNGPFMSLGFREGNRILCQVDICLSGERDGDYVFVFMHDRMIPEPLIPLEFSTSKINDGILAWCYDRPAAVMDDTLALLGSRLFSTPLGLEQILSDIRR
ncbi:MAG: hypothetical protein KKD44_15220 [Proteobacteria bacterium]|nr:hypothetical protein [Pseudomonadota bacterium]